MRELLINRLRHANLCSRDLMYESFCNTKFSQESTVTPICSSWLPTNYYLTSLFNDSDYSLQLCFHFLVFNNISLIFKEFDRIICLQNYLLNLKILKNFFSCITVFLNGYSSSYFRMTNLQGTVLVDYLHFTVDTLQ